MNAHLDPSTAEATSTDEAAPAATEAPKPRRPRGFAAMDRRRVSEIASKGGKAAHAAGTAHRFTSDEARVAGRKGGVAPHVRRGAARRKKEEVAPATEPAPASTA